MIREKEIEGRRASHREAGVFATTRVTGPKTLSPKPRTLTRSTNPLTEHYALIRKHE